MWWTTSRPRVKSQPKVLISSQRSDAGQDVHVPIEPDETIGQVVPHHVSAQNDATLHIRVKRPMKKMTLRVGDGFEKKLPFARPSEMIWVTVPKEVFRGASGPVVVRCEGR